MNGKAVFIKVTSWHLNKGAGQRNTMERLWFLANKEMDKEVVFAQETDVT